MPYYIEYLSTCPQNKSNRNYIIQNPLVSSPQCSKNQKISCNDFYISRFLQDLSLRKKIKRPILILGVKQIGNILHTILYWIAIFKIFIAVCDSPTLLLLPPIVILIFSSLFMAAAIIRMMDSFAQKMDLPTKNLDEEVHMVQNWLLPRLYVDDNHTVVVAVCLPW